MAGGFLVILALWVAWESRSFVVGFPADPVGPRALPLFAAAVLGGAGLYTLFRPEPNPLWPPSHTVLRLVTAVAILGAYPLALAWIGFVVATGGAVTLLSLLFQGPPVRSALAAFLFSGGLFLLFVHLLGVPLPVGQLFIRIMGW